MNAGAKMLVTINVSYIPAVHIVFEPVTEILLLKQPGSNTLSMFSINPNTPSKLTMVGNPVSSEGEFPMSVAINAKATMVCVLNGGAVDGVK